MSDSTSGSGSGTTRDQECEIEAQTILGFCAILAAQDTSLNATVAETAFTGTRAFFGLARCGDSDCFPGTAGANVYVLADAPSEKPDDFLDYPEPLIVVGVGTTGEAQEVTAIYRDFAAGVFASVQTSDVSILAAPVVEDFAAPLSETDPPRLRFQLDGSGPELEVSGVIDAVYCDAANFFNPCD